MKIKVLFFASFKEQLECAELETEIASQSNLGDLCELLKEKGPEWENLFSHSASSLKVAVNQEIAEFSHILHAGDEVAFFPPVTGG